MAEVVVAVEERARRHSPVSHNHHSLALALHSCHRMKWSDMLALEREPGCRPGEEGCRPEGEGEAVVVEELADTKAEVGRRAVVDTQVVEVDSSARRGHSWVVE